MIPLVCQGLSPISVTVPALLCGFHVMFLCFPCFEPRGHAVTWTHGFLHRYCYTEPALKQNQWVSFTEVTGQMEILAGLKYLWKLSWPYYYLTIIICLYSGLLPSSAFVPTPVEVSGTNRGLSELITGVSFALVVEGEFPHPNTPGCGSDTDD